MQRQFPLAVCLLTLFVLPSVADEAVTKEQVVRLVAQLVSPNPAPTERGSGVKYPPGYDKEAQKKVSAAFFELRKLGAPAFPYLFDHFGDRRYALSADGGAAVRNRTVGTLCY